MPKSKAAATPLDSRLNAYRRDLADENLRGTVAAQAFAAGVKARIGVPVADLYQSRPRRRAQPPAAPRNTAQPARAGAATQLLFGADVLVFERRGGYAWVQAQADSYVGYVRESALKADDAAQAKEQPTHYVAAPRSFVYSEADLRAAPTAALSLGSRLSIAGETEKRGTRYALLQSGEALIAAHLRPINCFAKDYVAVAETLLHTPYLWGGASAFGIDCSGLVQLALRCAGRQALRDSDMQAATLGAALKDTNELRRGDLVFWRGHVAILRDKTHIIHAGGASMAVSIEPLQVAIRRIAPLSGKPLLYRRP